MFDDPLIAAWEKVLAEILEPLAVFSIEVGMGLGDFHALTEKAFIKAAPLVLSEQGSDAPDNIAEQAVTTGIHRATIANTLDKPRGERPTPHQNPATMLLHGWRSLAGYCEGDGIAKILPIRGPAPSFHALVKSTVGNDLSPTLVLKTLRRRGVVKVIEKKYVQLLRYTLGPWSVEQIQELGPVGDHLQAHLLRLRRREPAPFIHHVSHSALPSELAAIRVNEFSRGAKSLVDSNQRVLDHIPQAPQSASDTVYRFSGLVICMREPVARSEQINGRNARTKRTAKQTARSGVKRKEPQ